MKKAISSFASANANKVLHMKKSTKIALGITAAATAAVAGAVAVKAVQAKKQERSIKSLVVEIRCEIGKRNIRRRCGGWFDKFRCGSGC